MTKMLVVPALLAKAHYDSYTKKDGTVVQAHDDNRAAAKPGGPKLMLPKKKPAAADYGHPNVVGKAEKLQGGAADKAHGFHFAGKEFSASGKEGTSFHDGTPVRHFKELTGSGDDDGQHLWMDHQARVHADDTSSVGKLRAQYEAHAKKPTK